MEDFSHGISLFSSIYSRITRKMKNRGEEMTLKLMMSPYARYQSTNVSTPIDIILRLLDFFYKTLEQHKTFLS
jgi:hypothetical protein